MQNLKIQDLPRRWDAPPSARRSRHSHEAKLSLRDVARIRALSEIYPGVDSDQVVSDLIRAALDELESQLPYVPGARVTARDEFGDPIYEDVGPSHRFHEATRRHLEALEAEEQPNHE